MLRLSTDEIYKVARAWRVINEPHAQSLQAMRPRFVWLLKVGFLKDLRVLVSYYETYVADRKVAKE